MSAAPKIANQSESLLAIDWYGLACGEGARRFTLGAGAKLVVIAAALITALNFYAPASPTFMERLLASAIILACFAPTLLWMNRTDRAIPFLPFVMVFFAFTYAVPVFLLRRFSTEVFRDPETPHDVTLALAYSLLGLMCLYAGYYGIVGRAVSDILPRINLRWRDPRAVKFVSLALTLLGLVTSASHAENHVPEQLALILSYVGDFSLIGICALVALQLTGNLDRVTSILIWGVFVPTRFFAGLGGAALASAMGIGIMILVIYATVRRRIPWTIFALGIAVVFVLRPIEIPYRIMTGKGGPLADASLVEKIGGLGDLLYRATVGGIVPAPVFIEACSNRLAQFTIFASVIHNTPGRVPYWEGESYAPLLTKLIPRLIMPDKPEEISGQTFGHRYGLISNSNTNTSVNLPQLVECYANFGVPGVIVGMFLIGLLYRMIIAIYVHPRMGLGAMIGAVYVTSRIFDIGSAASMVLGGIPFDMLAMAIFHLAVEVLEIDARAFMPSERSA
ncbi:MAG TPA: hypothetical protein VMA09_01420 [Candidatus Binataceae bacterium]|nr:hypothetical protein [Candidatus Binataceae bacterium]